MIPLIKCPICENEKWISLDHLREQRQWFASDLRHFEESIGFKVCEFCGFITYDYLEYDRLKYNYTIQRPSVQIGNIVTGNKKLEYHANFLKDIDFKNFTVLDYGCAVGLFLNYLHEEKSVPRENLYGIEMVDSLRNFAKYEYKVNVSEKLSNRSFDFICLYHTLEHLQYPDLVLKNCCEQLNQSGFLYISVPIWLDKMENDAGDDPQTFEMLYHVNHVNCFTYKSLHNLLRKSGFEIIKKDIEMYGYTILCKKTKKDDTIEIEDSKYIVAEIEKQKKAFELFQQKKFEEALTLYPRFANCYIHWSVWQDNMRNFDKQLEILNKGLEILPNNLTLLAQKARLYFQWDENNKEKQNFYSGNIRIAEKLIKDILEKKPGFDDFWFFLSMIELKYKKDYDKAVEYMRRSIKINPSKIREGLELIGKMWDAKGLISK